MGFDLVRRMGFSGLLVVAACSSSSPTTPETDALGGGTAGSPVLEAGGAGAMSAGSSGSGGTQSTIGTVDAAITADDAGAGACGAVVAEHPSEGAFHEDICSPLVYATNPPSSGNHYPIWSAYKTYAKTFLRGFWVHNLEHGAVVITYNCPEGCADEVAAAQAFIDALPVDPECPLKRRIVMLPDPELDVRFAASAWLFTLRASCFDPKAFAKFTADHYGHGLELVCDDGYDPLTAATGGKPICP